PTFSPDGRWIAYRSDESGRDETYVRPFPGPGGKWQISTGGGTNPTWSRTRHELFYGTPDQRIMVAPYTVEGDSFRAEKPRLWSEGRYTARLVLRNISHVNITAVFTLLWRGSWRIDRDRSCCPMSTAKPWSACNDRPAPGQG